MKRKKSREEDDSTIPTSFRVGVISLVFLVLGYQAAVFVHKAAVTKIASNRDCPDTVYVVDRALAASLLGVEGELGAAGAGGGFAAGGFAGGRGTAGTVAVGAGSAGLAAGAGVSGGVVVRRNAEHSPVAETVRSAVRRPVETFRFNPNTASKDELMRLGFSEKQAQSIINYREKGGQYRRKSDFAKSFVVSDSVYRRLEPYIVIPRLDINAADSAAFDALPGIGPYFAAQMVRHRAELGGYSTTEQLMDIYHFDREKYDALADLVYVNPASVRPFRLWTLPTDSLRLHPAIRSYETARAIVLYRQNNPRELWTVAGLERAGVISHEQSVQLSRCRIE